MRWQKKVGCIDMAKRNTYFQDEIPERRIDLKQLVKTLRYILPQHILACFLQISLGEYLCILLPFYRTP